MELIILNDGLYQLIPVTKQMLEGIELISEANCFDVCDILRLKLTGYVESINLHVNFFVLSLASVVSKSS